jgi:hypothetical protein
MPVKFERRNRDITAKGANLAERQRETLRVKFI